MKYVLLFDQNSDLIRQRPHDSILILQNCNQLIQTIEDTGTILREIRDLEEQVKLWQTHPARVRSTGEQNSRVLIRDSGPSVSRPEYRVSEQLPVILKQLRCD